MKKITTRTDIERAFRAGENLSGVDLRGGDFRGAEIAGVKLYKADLAGDWRNSPDVLHHTSALNDVLEHTDEK